MTITDNVNQISTVSRQELEEDFLEILITLRRAYRIVEHCALPVNSQPANQVEVCKSFVKMVEQSDFYHLL